LAGVLGVLAEEAFDGAHQAAGFKVTAGLVWVIRNGAPNLV